LNNAGFDNMMVDVVDSEGKTPREMNSSPKRSRSKIEKNQSKSFFKPGWQLALFVLASSGHLYLYLPFYL